MNNPFDTLNERLASIEQALSILSKEKETYLLSHIKEEEIGGVDLAIEVTKLKKATIYYYTHLRLIPHFKKGRKLYFDRTKLQEWLLTNPIATQEQLQAEPRALNNRKGGGR